MRIRKLAKKLKENITSDAEQPTKKRIKTAAMGGSYLDSACRTVCAFITLIAFCFFAFYRSDEYRIENGLTVCYTMLTLEYPVYPLVEKSETFNVSEHWQWLFYAHIVAGGYTIIQIVVATVAY